MEYVKDTELVYEIILSKGKGFLTKKAEKMIIDIGNNIMRKKNNSLYRRYEEKDDCLQNGIYHMLKNWTKFNEDKYYYALPYFTELFKRGMAMQYNEINYFKHKQGKLNVISLDELCE